MESSPENTARQVESGLNRLKSACRRPALWVLLSLFFLLLYCWPFLPNSRGWSGALRYFFLMGVWAANVLVIAAVAACLPPFRQGGKKGP